MKKTIATTFALIAILVSATPLPAVQNAERPARLEGAQKKKSDESKSDKSDSEKNDEKTKKSESKTAIVGGDIYTVTKGVIRDGTILIEDGKITAIGQDIEVGEEFVVIDAAGQKVCPGFVAIDMSGVGIERTASERGARYEDSLDPFDANVRLSAGIGITTGCVSIRGGGRGFFFAEKAGESYPRDNRFVGLDPDIEELEKLEKPLKRDIGTYVSVCECCGLPILPTEPVTPTRPSPIRPQKNAAIKMSYGVLDGMYIDKNVFVDLTPGALTGAANKKAWRDMIESARKYLSDVEAHKKATAAGKKQRPPRKTVSDEILKLVQGKAKLRIPAFLASDIRELIDLAEELDYELVIDGAGESWLTTEQLASSGTSVVLTPRRRREPNFGQEDSSGTWVETPRVLEETGIDFAITPLSDGISLGGLAGRDLTSLPLEAAFAVRGGASESEALAAITITPARMMGLDDRIGSLEKGKDADILIMNGNPLDYRTYVETALVNGKVIYERSKAKILPTED